MKIFEKETPYKGFIIRSKKEIVPYRAKTRKLVTVDGEEKNISIDETAPTEGEAINKVKIKIDAYIDQWGLEE